MFYKDTAITAVTALYSSTCAQKERKTAHFWSVFPRGCCANYACSEKTSQQMQPVAMVCKVGQICFLSQMVHTCIELPFHWILSDNSGLRREPRARQVSLTHNMQIESVTLASLSQPQKHFPSSSVIIEAVIIVQPCVVFQYDNCMGYTTKENRIKRQIMSVTVEKTVYQTID